MSEKGHPRSRARRREIRNEYKRERDDYGLYDNYKDPYKPRHLNTPYCPSSHSEKMQFDSEKEALNFIKYNGERIAEKNGHAPIRAYYCTSCCCWHVTSKEKRQKNSEVA